MWRLSWPPAPSVRAENSRRHLTPHPELYIKHNEGNRILFQYNNATFSIRRSKRLFDHVRGWAEYFLPIHSPRDKILTATDLVTFKENAVVLQTHVCFWYWATFPFCFYLVIFRKMCMQTILILLIRCKHYVAQISERYGSHI